MRVLLFLPVEELDDRRARSAPHRAAAAAGADAAGDRRRMALRRPPRRDVPTLLRLVGPAVGARARGPAPARRPSTCSYRPHPSFTELRIHDDWCAWARKTPGEPRRLRIETSRSAAALALAAFPPSAAAAKEHRAAVMRRAGVARAWRHAGRRSET